MELDLIDPQLYYDEETKGSLFDPSTFSIVHRLPFPSSSKGRDAEEFHKTNLHEITHWLQFSSTTVGIFCSLCGLAQSQQLSKWLGALSDIQREEFYVHHDSGKTLFTVRQSSNLICNLPQFTEDGTDYLGSYIACYYGQQLLLDTQSMKHMGVRPRLLKQSLELLTGFPWADQQFSYTPNVLDRKLEDDVNYEELDVGCSTYDLLESAAVVQEVMSIGQATDDFDSPELEETVRLSTRRLLGLDSPSYSKAFRVWVGKHQELQIMGSDVPNVDRLGEALFTYALLADAALNPPLPPIYQIEEVGKLLWKDIHPPARFSLLVDAAAKMPLICRESSGQESLAWIREALEKAKLPGLHLDLVDTPFSGTDFDYGFNDDFCFVEATLLPRFKRLLNLRILDFVALVCPGEIVHSRQLECPESKEAYDESFWLPIFLNSDYVVHSFMPQDAAARYAESANLRRTMRFAPLLTIPDIVKKPHHATFATMRPEKGFEVNSLRNLVKQYDAITLPK